MNNEYIEIGMCKNLNEIFGGHIDSEVIVRICKDNNWNFDDCFEKLIEYSENEKLSTMDVPIPTLLKPTLPPPSLPVPVKIEPMENQNINGFSGVGHALTSISNTNLSSKAFLGAIPKKINSSPVINDNSSSYTKFKQIPKNKILYDSIIDSINAGHKIMIILRGPPGCGKSFLAEKIIDQTVNENYKKFICSTDDYFYNINDYYMFRAEKLSDAHEFNQKKVRKRCGDGWSPVIVDNTNTKVWEMLPYVQAAIQNGYDFEILEPDTAWFKCPGKLALKNKHNVSKDKIEKIIKYYEPCTKLQLLQMMKNTTYSSPIPQFRLYPPISYNKLDLNNDALNSELEESEKEIISLMENFELTSLGPWIKPDTKPKEANEDLLLKNQRLIENELPKPSIFIKEELPKTSSLIKDELQYLKSYNNEAPVEENKWTPYEQDAVDFWKTKYKFTSENNENSAKNYNKIKKLPQRLNNKDKFLSSEEKIFNIIKQDFIEKSIIKNNIPDKEMNIEEENIEHDINCPFSNVSFLMAKQVFPTKKISDLWNLFEICNGELNVVIDTILRDDSSIPDKINEFDDLDFCKCSKELINIRPKSEPLELTKESHSSFDTFDNTVKKKHNNKTSKPELIELKKKIENNVIVPTRFYSEYINKIKKSKHIYDTDIEMGSEIEYNFNSDNIENSEIIENNIKTSDDSDSDTNNFDPDDMVEINLGTELVQQLENIFDQNSLVPKNDLQNFKTNIFMPKELAHQLFMLWLESFYNQQEEQKFKTIREDEEFAKVLQNTSIHLDNQDSYQDILDMEMAWNAYKSDETKWKHSKPENLAQYLTELKLQEMYPTYDKETLLEIFEAHNKSFSETVSALELHQNKDVNKNNEELKLKKTNLLNFVQNETEKDNVFDLRNTFNERTTTNNLVNRDNALKEFEESRNLASHYSQLKAECHKKARESFKKNQTSVALYYSRIATLHKNKIDHYNQLAANSIMEVHEFSQTNPDFIDLHYLHTNEAIQCLDIFIDRHITKLRIISKNYNHIFIITGRGLHSISGISIIKGRVKTRLKERNLKWIEVNPGLLKVKIFQGSRFTNKTS